MTLEAGEYELSAVTPDTNVYASLVALHGQTLKLSTRTSNPQTATLDAGQYVMRVGVAYAPNVPTTVDATITPTLTRTN